MMRLSFRPLLKTALILPVSSLVFISVTGLRLLLYSSPDSHLFLVLSVIDYVHS